MRNSRRQLKALRAFNLNLFEVESASTPAPATLYTRIRQEAGQRFDQAAINMEPCPADLPTAEALDLLFDRFNWMYFEGRLPTPRIEYSNRMTSAGSYIPSQKLIRIGRKYHQLFPEDLHDTIKHEMIHMLHLRHDAAFKQEAARVGATVTAKSHPALRRPPKYVYICPGCGKLYPRQKQFRMASCGDCSAGGEFDERFKLKLKKSFRRR